MSSRINIAGHPIHPMLVPLPIGLLTFSVICDFASLWDIANGAWSTVALYTLGGGIAGALLAAVFGFIDLVSLDPSPARRIGVWHMVLNLTLVALFAASFWLRMDGVTSRLPILLSITGVLLLVISGWLGGHMVFVHGVAVGRWRS